MSAEAEISRTAAVTMAAMEARIAKLETALRWIALADYSRIDAATLGNIARAAL